jgi:hypothetical protein
MAAAGPAAHFDRNERHAIYRTGPLQTFSVTGPLMKNARDEVLVRPWRWPAWIGSERADPNGVGFESD